MSHSRRDFLKGAGALAAGMAFSGLPALADEIRKKPNVVFIFSDQLRSHALGCYGDKQAKTPNIDRLAADGMRFTNAISTWPVCSPYRGMLMTGCYPMSNGVVENNRPIWDDQESVATTFKAAGYVTGYLGKWHLNGDDNRDVPKDRQLGFDYWDFGQRGAFVQAVNGEDAVWKPEDLTNRGIKFIKENKDKPFCLMVSWSPPHDPYVAPKRYMDMFKPSDMKLRPNVAESDLVRARLEKYPVAPGSDAEKKRRNWRKRIDSDDGVREMMAGYYAAVAGVDVCVGRFMDTLEELGLAEDTIFVFTSDHGDMLGSHRMSHKQEPFEEAIAVPFIVRYPKEIPKGKTTDALLSPVDILPTLLGLAKAPIPKSIEGMDLADAALGKKSDQQDALLIMKLQPGGNPWTVNATTEWRGVRTKTHTYARMEKGGPWVLYDNVKDTYQMNNLVNDPDHRALRRQLEAKMKVLLEKAHDPFDAEKIRKRIEEQTKTRLKSARV